ncbi:MAG: hypothetical protein ACI4D7_00305 [Lachnospiraceae bacterium]
MEKRVQENTEKKEKQEPILLSPDQDFPDLWYRKKLTDDMTPSKFFLEQSKKYDEKLKAIQSGTRSVTPRKIICSMTMGGATYLIYDIFIERGVKYAYGLEVDVPYNQTQKAEMFRVTRNNEFRTISEQQRVDLFQLYTWEYRLLDVIPRCVRHLIWDHVDIVQENSYYTEQNHSYTVPEVTGWLPRPFPYGKLHIVIRNTTDPVTAVKGFGVDPDTKVSTPLDGYMVADIVGLPHIRDTFVALAYPKYGEKVMPILDKPYYFLFKRDEKQKLEISRIPDSDLEFYLEECGLLERFALIMTQMQDLQFLYE